MTLTDHAGSSLPWRTQGSQLAAQHTRDAALLTAISMP